MEDYGDLLKKEQNNPNGALLEVLSSGYEKWDYVFAVEGRTDIIFYYDFVKNLLPNSNIYFLDCSNKDGVLAFKVAAENYRWVNPPKFRFLCDKDYDDFINKKESGVWYTDRYSIESYISDGGYVKYCIDKFATTRLSRLEIERIADAYQINFLSLSRLVRSYCALMCEIRGAGLHPNFDLFGIEELFDLASDPIRAKKSRASRALKLFGVEVQVSYISLLSRSRSFKMNEVLTWLRGKLALQIARKSYELTRRSLSSNIRDSLPSANFLGSHGLASAFLHWGALPGLAEYCD